ncbi:hypothetical protein ABZP36_016362 [Zizania latifolia]
MDPAADPLAASAPFPTIPAVSHPRPRGARPRRQAAPFRSDHPVAAGSSSSRRLGVEVPFGAAGHGSRRSAAFVFGGEPASSLDVEGCSPSASSWSSSSGSSFVFGASGMRRSLSFGSGKVSSPSFTTTVGELILDDSGSRQSDADDSRGNDSVLEINVGDGFGSRGTSLNMHEAFHPSIVHEETEHCDREHVIPSETMGRESTDSNKNAVMEFTKDENCLSIEDSADEGNFTKDASKMSADCYDMKESKFVFVFGDNAEERGFTTNIAQIEIKNGNSVEKESVACGSEQCDASVDEGNACTKSSLQDARHACGSSMRDPPHLGPHGHGVATIAKASNTPTFDFVLQDGIANNEDSNCFSLQTTESNNDRTVFTSAINLKSSSQSDFIFAASTSGQSTLHSQRRHNKKKCGGMSNHANSIQSIPTSAIGLVCSEFSRQQHTDLGTQWTKYNEADPKIVTMSRGPTFKENLGHQEDCEIWRIRGNQAYAEGQFAKAEECYTCGINSVCLNEASSKALMLCYSNRAATWMSLGRMREALSDSRKAIDIDSSFLKAQVRAANCLLSLGDVEEAQKGFEICLKSNRAASLDNKIVEEVSDGLKNAQKVSNFMLQSKEYLVKRTFDKIPSALQMISDALSISIYSDNLMMMKAEALLLLQRYEDVIHFCEETLHLAEENSVPLCQHSKIFELDNCSSSVKLWRYYLIAKSYFFIGKLEEANQFLKKHEQEALVECRYGKQSQQSVSSFSTAICELLHLKTAGNEAFQAGKYSEAVEHYTAALLSNTESLRISAICFANRAAAYQAMGQILDAIADCSLAIALDSNYSKAISRRAGLYELIRDYDQAENDLRRLIYLLEKQLQENMSMPSEKSEGIRSSLIHANVTLSALERDAKKGISLNIYLILGIEPSCTYMDIKKAYRKAALRHHPDKAGNFLVRSENINDALWREIGSEIRKDADYLFKLIGKAYAILSDATMTSK